MDNKTMRSFPLAASDYDKRSATCMSSTNREEANDYPDESSVRKRRASAPRNNGPCGEYLSHIPLANDHGSTLGCASLLSRKRFSASLTLSQALGNLVGIIFEKELLQTSGACSCPLSATCVYLTASNMPMVRQCGMASAPLSPHRAMSLPPELILPGPEAHTPAAEVHAASWLFYTMLVDRMPIESPLLEAFDLGHEATILPLSPAFCAARDIPRELNQLIRRALHPDPTQRPENLNAFIKELFPHIPAEFRSMAKQILHRGAAHPNGAGVSHELRDLFNNDTILARNEALERLLWTVYASEFFRSSHILAHSLLAVREHAEMNAVQGIRPSRLGSLLNSLGAEVFAPPEVLLHGPEAIDARTEVFIAGALFFKLRTGQDPARSPQLDPFGLGHEADCRPPSMHLLDRLIRNALHRDPEQRPDNLKEFVKALRSHTPMELRGFVDRIVGM